jgi:hypothetical protein
MNSVWERAKGKKWITGIPKNVRMIELLKKS